MKLFKIILAPVWVPLFIALYLAWIILSLALLIFLPVICISIVSAVLITPLLLINHFFFPELPVWLIVLSVIAVALGTYGGICLSSRIMDTDFFRAICFFKNENIDQGVFEDYMSK